jgi:transposase-like protein
VEKKIRASEEKDKLFEEILRSSDPSAFRELIGRGIEKLIQKGLEEEVSEFLGREWYEHRGKGASEEEEPVRKGYRNGYYDRGIRTAEGAVRIREPRVRDTEEPFESKILEKLDYLEDNLKELATELYVRGLSTRDIEETFVDENGKALLSRSSVSRLNDKLWEEYEEFRKRDLSGIDVVYLYADGVYESIKRYTNNQTILCAWVICSDGHKEILHLMAVNSESTESWESFFRDMLDRGLRQPLLVTTDGNKGVHRAVVECFPKADRQRCIAHKLRNILSRLPQEKQEEVLEQIKAVYYAPDRETADLLAQRVIEKYADMYPSATQTFSEDLDACLVHLKYPAGHRKFIRTTNLLERSFEEEKRRTKVIPQHVHEKGALSLVFAVLWRASQRWQRVTMTSLELAQLRQIRHLICPHDNETEFLSYRLAA